MNTSLNRYLLARRWHLAALFTLTLSACVSNPSAPANDTGNKVETTSQSNDNDKAMKKISMAIGVDTNEFSITNTQKTDAPMGYEGNQYTVKTNAGKTYKCEILENSGFGKVMTFGMGTGASAMCTDFTQGSKDQGKTNKASCNALLKAANKC